jgi:hypothetical protein
VIADVSEDRSVFVFSVKQSVTRMSDLKALADPKLSVSLSGSAVVRRSFPTAESEILEV